MRKFLITISFFIVLPLAANEDLKQLEETVLQSLRAHQYDSITLAQGEELLKASKKEDATYYIVRSYYILGFIYSKTEEYGKAVLFFLEGARFAESSSEKEIKENLISIYKNLALITSDYKHFDLAHKFNQKGLEVASEINNEKQILNLLHNDGYDYVDEKKYDSAINVFQHILTEYQPDFRKEVGLKNDLGIAYRNLGRLDEAISQYQSILDLRDSIQDIRLIGKVRHNLGLALMDKREYEKALTYFEAASEVNFKGGFTNSLFGNYKYTGLCLYNLGRKDEAIEYYLKAADLFNKEYVDPEDYDIFELIANFYHAHDQPELAYQYGKLYNEHLEDFIARQKEIEELDKKYNMELLTQRYFDLLAAEERHRETLRTAQFGLGSGIALLLSILFYIAYRRYRNRMEIAQRLRAIEHDSLV